LRVVSLTPSRVDRDSRTFKAAASLARLGYESLVVEGRASEVVEGLPFELVGAGTDDGGAPAPAADPRPAAGLLRRLANRALSVPLTIAQHLRAGPELPAADLYWLHGYHQFPAVRRAARRYGVPVVYDAHDFYPDVMSAGAETAVESWAMRRFYLALERACARQATEVVTVSQGVARLIEQRTGRRASVIRNCADPRLGQSGGAGVRDAAGVPRDAFLVVVSGNFKPGMRADEALAALAQLPAAAHLAFVGAGYEPVAARARGLGVSDRAHMLNPVPARALPDFMRSADAAAVIYAASSRNLESALPNGFFGAVAAGLPVVYSSELRELCALAQELGLGIAADPRAPDSIAAGVRSLMDDPALRAELRANVERARGELSWEREERVLAEVARRALAPGLA
jgi:glycosyltransferase involved in cell wall biosynthesis